MPYTVGKLAKKFGLSRSTLLYYDSIGLLEPEARGENGYRQYGEASVERLALICHYRMAGLPLEHIKEVLDSPDSALSRVLEKRLEELNVEIAQAEEQRAFVLRLLQNKEGMVASSTEDGMMNEKLWTSLLADSGFSEEDMRKWHRAFEARSPEKHHRFLTFLRIPEEEISRIRAWCQEARPDDTPLQNSGA